MNSKPEFYPTLQAIAQFTNALPYTPNGTPCPVHILKYNELEEGYEYLTDFSKFVKIDTPTFTGIDTPTACRLEALYSQPGVNFLEPSQRRDKIEKLKSAETRRIFVGLDDEYKDLKDAQGNVLFTLDGCTDVALVSQQYYIAWNGHRKCIILISPQPKERDPKTGRFTERELLDFLSIISQEREASGEVIPEKPGKKPKMEVYLVAHFSIIEGGWLILSTERSHEVRHLRGILKDTETYTSFLAISATLKLLINRIFREAPKTHGLKGKLNEIPLTSAENLVISYDDSLRCLDPLYAHLTPHIIRRIQHLINPLEAFNAICCRKRGYEDIIGFFDLPIEVREYLQQTTLEAPVIPTRDKTWHGSRICYSAAELDDLKKKAHTKLKESLKYRAIAPIPQQFASATGTTKHQLQAFENRQALITQAVQILHSNCATGTRNFYAISGRDLRPGFEGRRTRRIRSGAKEKLPDLPKRQVIFVDSNGFGSPSLKGVGDTIGIAKLEISQSAYEDMSAFAEEHPEKFIAYGIVDPAISAECVAWHARHFRCEMDLDLKTRTASYSAAYIRKVLINEVYTADRFVGAQADRAGKDYRAYLGWDHSKVEMPPDPLDPAGSAKELKIWEPSLRHKQFSIFYSGGWNAAFQVGSLGECGYHDFKSAYPSAYSCLAFDYDFGKPIRLQGQEARDFLMDSMQYGPGQIIGIHINYTGYPGSSAMFATRIDEHKVSATLTPEGEDICLFLRSAEAHIMMPEFWTALKHNILEPGYTIHSIETFERLPGPSRLAEVFYNMLSQRGKPGMKALWKATANYSYGKFAESIKKVAKKKADTLQFEKVHPGPITCYPLAAYATSMTRSCIGELLNCGNECYAVTTDGFIAPETDSKKLKTGPLIELVQKRISGLYEVKTDEFGNEMWNGYDFIELAHKAQKSLILRTRGYILIGEDEEGKQDIKIARNGIQTRRPHPSDKFEDNQQVFEILEKLVEGSYIKYSWRGFARLRKDGVSRPPVQIKSRTRISHSFDVKRIPVGEVENSEFEYRGTIYNHPKFNTRDLEDASEYVIHRKARCRNMTVEDYQELIEKYKDRVILPDPKAITRIQPTMSVCLCGSMRFADRFAELDATMTLNGHLVSRPILLPAGSGSPSDDQKKRLRNAHFTKIHAADVICIVDCDAPGQTPYTGEDTEREIEHALSLKKRIRRCSHCNLSCPHARVF